MNVLIIEDNISQARYLRENLLIHYPNMNIYGPYHHLHDTLNINWSIIDLLFLDVEVGEYNSIEFLKSKDLGKVDIIITSAHEKYALDSFYIHPFQYLLKPIDVDELKKVVDEWKDQREGKSSSVKIKVKVKDHSLLVDSNDIMYIKAQGPYAEITTKHGHTYWISKNLKALEQILDPNKFVRVHHSYLLHIAHIQQIRDDRYCLMTDGQEIPIAVRKKEVLRTLGWKV